MVRGKRVPEGSDRDKWEQEKTAKEAVRKNIGKQQDYLKKLKGIKIAPVSNPLVRKKLEKIITGTALDRILSKDGGIEVGSTAEFYGEFASGKTQICLALAAEAMQNGLVVFIDAEMTFRTDRFLEICEARNIDVEKHGGRFRLYQPKDWIEQEAVSHNLPEFDDDGKFLIVRLIVVDSLMRHWAAASEFYGRDKLTYRQQLVRSQTHRLADYARRHKGILVYTNQIYDKPVDTTFAPPESKVGSRGGRTLEHIGDYRIFLRKGRGNLRFARLVDSPDLPLLEVPFILEESGILDIPDPAERAKAVVIGKKYDQKFMAGQVTSSSAGEEYKLEALRLGYISGEEAIDMGVPEKKVRKVLDAMGQTMDERIEDEVSEIEKETELKTVDVVIPQDAK